MRTITVTPIPGVLIGLTFRGAIFVASPQEEASNGIARGQGRIGEGRMEGTGWIADTNARWIHGLPCNFTGVAWCRKLALVVHRGSLRPDRRWDGWDRLLRDRRLARGAASRM